MAWQLYTLGYEKRSLEEFIEVLRGAEIDVLVDVRDTAWSHKPGFSRTSFSQRLACAGIDYVHASFAGNPKWLRTNATSHAECLRLYSWYLDEHHEIVPAFDALLSRFFVVGKRVCITCFERHADDCHRGILAQRWQALGTRRVKHLATGGGQRLTRD
jgi:uncharacterized protein (DUF488 family)